MQQYVYGSIAQHIILAQEQNTGTAVDTGTAEYWYSSMVLAQQYNTGTGP